MLFDTGLFNSLRKKVMIFMANMINVTSKAPGITVMLVTEIYRPSQITVLI